MLRRVGNGLVLAGVAAYLAAPTLSIPTAPTYLYVSVVGLGFAVGFLFPNF